MLGQNLSEVAETVLKGKSAVVNTFKKDFNSTTSLYNWEILNRQLAKGRKKVRVETNEIENRKTMEKNQWNQNLVLEKD